MDTGTRRDIESLLRGNSRYVYLFRCGLDDLEKGINQRQFRLNQEKSGVVLASQIDRTNIFYSVGTISQKDLEWILELPEPGELYFDEEHTPQVEALRKQHSRMGDLSRVRFYHLNDFANAEEDEECRMAGPSDLLEIQNLANQFYPASVFSERMLFHPFAGLWKDGQLIATAGTTYMNEKYKVCQIGNFLTHPHFRGKGYSKTVGKHLLKELQNNGIVEVRLEVYDRNVPACRVYESLGFKVEKMGLESLISGLKSK